MSRLRFVLVLLGVIGLVPAAQGNEGQWTPDQIAQIVEADPQKLSGMGLTLSPEALWNAAGDEKTGGLLRAAVNYSGCSAAFVSAESGNVPVASFRATHFRVSSAMNSLLFAPMRWRTKR